jgi:predicted regulator of Ras-like GTPase activity (Roadblock/LC7/MglB family)
MSRLDDLNHVLRQLQAQTPDVEASALISDDGLMIASALPQHVDETRVAGMSAVLLSSLGAARGPRSSSRGEPDEVIIRGAQGYVIMVAATPGTLLLLLAGRDAKLGLVFLDVGRAVQQIKKIL